MSTSSTAFVSTDRTSPQGSSMNSVVTLSEYANFHGMVCSPSTATRCIDSFAGGTILFMQSNYAPQTLSSFDCSAKGVLTPLSYYLLVIFSLTGLSTMLRLTEFRIAQEFPTEQAKDATAPMTSTFNSKLRVESYVLDYCKEHTMAKSLVLKRRFEYYFKLIGLEVVMLHFECDQNKLHLVEVLDFNHWIWQDLLAPFLLSFGKRFRDFVRHTNRKKK